MARDTKWRAAIEKQFPGWHPLIQLAQGAHDPDLQPQERLRCAETVCKYMSPQLKAVEHAGEVTTRQIMDVDGIAARDAAKSIADSIGLH